MEGNAGDSVLKVAHDNNIDLEGACDSSLACSTCHVYISEPHFGQISAACDGEEDMLDLAACLKVNSRLGCQVQALTFHQS